MGRKKFPKTKERHLKRTEISVSNDDEPNTLTVATVGKSQLHYSMSYNGHFDKYSSRWEKNMNWLDDDSFKSPVQSP